MVIRSIASATGKTTEEIDEKKKVKGDLGKAAEEELAVKKQTSLLTKPLEIKYVSDLILKIIIQLMK